jgi:lipopolysaccharide cholinephosphotransferase
MRKLKINEIQKIQLDLMKIVHEVCIKENIRYYLISGSCLGAVRHQGFIPWDDDIDVGMLRDDYEHFIRVFDKHFDTKKYFLQNEHTDVDFTFPMSRICVLGTNLIYYRTQHLRYCKCMFMDIFPLDNVPDDERCRNTQIREYGFLKYIIAKKVYMLSDNVTINILNSIVSKLLFFIPLCFLLTLRYKIQTRYRHVQTQCVCSMASKYGCRKHIMNRDIYGTPKLMKFEDSEFFFPEKSDEHLRHLFGKNYMVLPPESKRGKASDVYMLEDNDLLHESCTNFLKK